MHPEARKTVEPRTPTAVLPKNAKTCRSNVALLFFKIAVVGPENGEKI
jgi:hypothetical protein